MGIRQNAPDQYRAMLRLDRESANGQIERRIAELVRIRASQLNGCAYCVDMHSKDARSIGLPEELVYGVATWREAPFYDERERAALALTEALTRNVDHDATDRARDAAEAIFSPEEYAALVCVIATINAWNVVAVGGRSVAGEYQPEGAATA